VDKIALAKDKLAAQACASVMKLQAASSLAGSPSSKRLPNGEHTSSLDTTKLQNNPCDLKRLFVRADPLDNFHYALDPSNPDGSVADAKGATISYTNDKVAATQKATVNGRVSYVLFGQKCLPTPDPLPIFWENAFAIAPFVSGNGTWNEPLPKNTSTSNSALKTGADLAFSVSSTNPFVPNLQYFYISPYYQTDFRGLANIQGVDLAWEPIIPQIALGGNLNNPLLGFFWNFRGEVEFTEVYERGLTNLARGAHEWVGGTTRANFQLFPIYPGSDWDWIAGRITLIGTAENYYDARNATWANYYSAVLQYKLGECKKPDPLKPGELNLCKIQGQSSISFEYDWGTEKDTNVYTKQYLIKLGFAY
jgi:hypothetical protein